MTPYERGQIAMRERAAAECYAESVRWRNEAGEHQPAQALCAVRILSLQPEGADQRGTGEDSRAEQSCENRAPHHNPGEQVSSVENPDSLSVGARPARPGPSQECVSVPFSIAYHLESMSLEMGGKCHICSQFRSLLAAAKEEHDAHR